jgi:DNA repair protein RadD
LNHVRWLRHGRKSRAGVLPGNLFLGPPGCGGSRSQPPIDRKQLSIPVITKLSGIAAGSSPARNTMNEIKPLWPHQRRAIDSVLASIARGERRICVASPTGSGKSRIMEELARHYLKDNKKVIFYSNRLFLIEQMSSNLTEAGLFHGIRSDSDDEAPEHNFQISSLQTENSKVLKRKERELHDASLVILDECHVNCGPTVQEILQRHYDSGAAYVGMTATPLGLAEIYNELICDVTMQELRECGALVPAVAYGADEPELKAWKKARKKWNLSEHQDPSQRQQGEIMMTPSIFGRVWEWYEKLNPERKPCLLFGPSVEGSLWFAEQFTKKGIRTAHVDGNDVWFEGKLYKADPKAREDMRHAHRDGKIKVVTNRYVLREGVDWPWISHIILAFVAGSLQTYLQTCGRGLRSYPGKENCIIQGHGGEWWRHGSVNADREWRLDMDDNMAFGLRAEKMRKKWCDGCKCYYETKSETCPECFTVLRGQEKPFRCPKCGRVWAMGRECKAQWGGCGFVLEPGMRFSRPVVSTEGELRMLEGELFAPRRISTQPNGPEVWKRMYWRSRTEKGRRTFNAAFALFAQENYWAWPNRRWPLMPIQDIDCFRLIEDCPMENLVPDSKRQERFR